MKESTPIKSIPFAIVDIETTGLSHACGHRICEIAVLRVKNRKKEASYETLVNPGCRISSGASYVNGITNDMVKTAPGFNEITGKLLKMFKGAVIVCHNAPFDLGFINKQFSELHLPVPENPVLDTLKLARRCYTFSSNSLGYIARELCIPLDNEHRAMGDVITTGKVLDSFLEDFVKEGKSTLKDLLNI